MRKKLSDATRFDVLERDGFTCQYCGKSAPEVVLEVDHITPVARGGTNEIDNLIAACEQCNGGKSARQLTHNPAPIQYRDLYERSREKAAYLAIAWAYAELGKIPVSTSLRHGHELARIDVLKARNLFDEMKVWAELTGAEQPAVWGRFFMRLQEVSNA